MVCSLHQSCGRAIRGAVQDGDPAQLQLDVAVHVFEVEGVLEVTFLRDATERDVQHPLPLPQVHLPGQVLLHVVDPVGVPVPYLDLRYCIQLISCHAAFLAIGGVKSGSGLA